MTTLHAPQLRPRPISPFGFAALAIGCLAVAVLVSVLYFWPEAQSRPDREAQFFDNQAHSLTGADGGGHLGGTR